MTLRLLPPATGDRPEPVLDAAKLAAAVSGAVTAVGAIFVLIGWATTDQVQAWAVIAGGIVTALGAVLATILPLITAAGARAQVTPLSDPRGVNGGPLLAVVPDPPGEHAVDNPNHSAQED